MSVVVISQILLQINGPSASHLEGSKCREEIIYLESVMIPSGDTHSYHRLLLPLYALKKTTEPINYGADVIF